MSRQRSLFVAGLLALLVVTVPAWATHWVDFQATADCQGWHVDAEVKIAAAHPYLDIPYTVVLTAGNDELERQEGSVRVFLSATTSPFSVEGTWSDALGVAASCQVTFVLPFVSEGDSIQSATIGLACGEPVVAHRPRWWIRHRDAWPVPGLTIAGNEYDQAHLIRLMRRCTRHRLSVRLFRHLVAAELNVAAGVPDMAHEAIAAADAFFVTHGLNGRLNRPARREARALLRELRRFNRGQAAGKSLMDDPLPLTDFEDETLPWGEIKSAYR